MLTMNSATEYSVNRWFQSMREGNKVAFERIFNNYYPNLYAYACRFVDSADAEDAVQTVMQNLWERRSSLSYDIQLSPYLFRAVYYRCMTCITHGQARKRTEARFWEIIPDTIGIDNDSFDREKLIIRLEEALDSLPEEWREVIVMQKFQGMSYAQIAEKLGVTTKTVDHRMQKAMNALRIMLKDAPILLILLGI